MQERIVARQAELEKEAMELTARTQWLVQTQKQCQRRLLEIKGGLEVLGALLEAEDGERSGELLCEAGAAEEEA